MSIGWSQDSKDPGSTTRSISSRADQRWLIAGCPSHAATARTDSPCWSSAGGAACGAVRDLGAVGLEEAQRWARQRHWTEDRRGPRRSAGPGWRSAPSRRPRRWVRTLPAGTPTSARCASNGSASQSAKTSSTSSIVLLAVGYSLAGSWPVPRSSHPHRSLRRSGATAPRCRLRSGHCRRDSGRARTARSTGDGCPAPGRPRPRLSTSCPGRRARRRSRRAARS